MDVTYHHIHADTKDAETVYVLNTGLYRSTDGGRNWTAITTPHGDNHDLWIDPNDPQRRVVKTAMLSNDSSAAPYCLP